MSLFDHIVVPIANEDDAIATATALSPHLDTLQRITAVHVIEKGGGVVDKAPMEKRLSDATRILSALESRLDDDVPIETRVEFGTNPAETIVETALDANATAIAFLPRGGNRFVRLLSGDTADRLVANSEVPVVSLHAVDEARSSRRVGSGTNDSEVSG
ncbi:MULTISPECIES: universal stress protein [Haloferax]|uniref:Universal stress protein n=2 Tax=Haloferax TaxID=2251 RepID=A0A6G1YY77_9EURY|nr:MULTISPECIES: universal stress protein [Haloferax]KAB1186601.1 universal stress protein [Haloferax sp. CBA1149]MRW79216.1 universal stress protein [Haloferax marinisediminis]